MLIRCPECQFERRVDISKIPATAQLATCPKCQLKFRFREYIVEELKAEAFSPYSNVRESSSTDADSDTPVHASDPAPASDTAQPADHPASLHRDMHTSVREEEQNTSVSAETMYYVKKPNRAGHNAAVDNFGRETTHSAETPASGVQEHSGVTDDSHAHEASAVPQVSEDMHDGSADDTLAMQHQEPKVAKPHRHLGMISDFDDGSGKGDIWDAIAAMGESDGSDIPQLMRSAPFEVTVPWENRGKLSVLSAWRQTTGQILFAPSGFFGAFQGAGGMASPFVYSMLNVLVSIAAAVCGLYLVTSLWGAALNEVGLGFANGIISDFADVPMLAAKAAGGAVGGLIGLSVLLHVCLRFISSRVRPYATTFRVVAYCGGAVALMGIIPVFGFIAALPYFLGLSIVGMRHAHTLSWKQTILAVLPAYVLILALVTMAVGVGL